MVEEVDISHYDREQIEKLREAVKDDVTEYYDTDFNYLRWLQGHHYKFDVIIPKLKNHLKLRKSAWNLDAEADKARSHPVHAYWKAGLTGPSGRTPNTIVNVEQTGANDYWGMLSTFSTCDLLRARVHDLEKMLRYVIDMEKQTKKQAHIIYIMDLNGLSYDRRLLFIITGSLSSLSSFMSEHYVEMIQSFVLVNAPAFISTIWALARPILPERTREKVKILGSNWRQEIKEFADPEVLPAFWNENESIFKANIEQAVAVDPQLYYKHEMKDNAKLLIVPAGKFLLLAVPVRKGSLVHWWLSTDGEFAFSVYFTENEDETDISNMQNVYPIFKKIPGPTMVPMVDEILCKEDGFYQFWFSNEHAWFHNLKINYVIDERS